MHPPRRSMSPAQQIGGSSDLMLLSEPPRSAVPLSRPVDFRKRPPGDEAFIPPSPLRWRRPSTWGVEKDLRASAASDRRKRGPSAASLPADEHCQAASFETCRSRLGMLRSHPAAASRASGRWKAQGLDAYVASSVFLLRSAAGRVVRVVRNLTSARKSGVDAPARR